MKKVKTYKVTLLTTNSSGNYASEILVDSSEESAKKYGEYLLSLPCYSEICDKFKVEHISTIYCKE